MGGVTHVDLMLEKRAVLIVETVLGESRLGPLPGLHLHRQLDLLL